jgi:hypothetical protein
LSAVLKENNIYSYVNYVVEALAINLVSLHLHETKEAKPQRIILDGVKDHLIPHLAEKKTAKEMWDALKNLFEAKNENRKMALRLNCMIPRWVRRRVSLLILLGWLNLKMSWQLLERSLRILSW